MKEFNKLNKKVMRTCKTSILMIVGIIAISIIIGVITIPMNFNDHSYTVTVTDKERIVESNNKSTTSKYLVFTEDKDGNEHVFENEDTLLRGKFDSSDIQGKLKVNTKYTVKVVGYRIPFLSLYENIIEIKGDK